MAVGRYLAETVASVPHFSKAEFESLMEVRCVLCTPCLGPRMDHTRRRAT